MSFSLPNIFKKTLLFLALLPCFSYFLPSFVSALEEEIPLQEPSSAFDIIRSRSLWQEKGQSLAKDEQIEGLPFEAERATFSETLTVLGASSLAATTIAGPFTQDGTLMITEGKKIDVVGDVLYLQSEGLGAIDFIAGKMKLDREGSLVVSGQLSAAGGIKTDFISPLASDAVTVGQNLVVEGDATVGNLYSQGAVNSNSLIVNGKTDLTGPVTIHDSPLTIYGNLTASDYARVGDLILDRGLTIADTGNAPSVGTATIYADGTRQVIVPNTRVTERSRIFLSVDTSSYPLPAAHYPLPALFVSQKLPGSYFVVATDKPMEQDITFNWLMVN